VCCSFSACGSSRRISALVSLGVRFVHVWLRSQPRTPRAGWSGGVYPSAERTNGLWSHSPREASRCSGSSFEALRQSDVFFFVAERSVEPRARAFAAPVSSDTQASPWRHAHSSAATISRRPTPRRSTCGRRQVPRRMRRCRERSCVALMLSRIQRSRLPLRLVWRWPPSPPPSVREW
jgi:hypothetical protein